MFIVVIIGLMLCGVLMGYLFRSQNLRFIQRFITGLIWILLFLLGLEVGNNKAIINGLHIIGFEALLITLFAVGGSVFAAWGLWLVIGKKKQE